MKTIVRTDAAPKAIGPYSQAVLADGWLYCSGQIPLDPATMQVVPGDAAAQAERVLLNLVAVVKAAGGSMADAVKVTIFLTDMSNFGKIVELRGKWFTPPFPADTIVEVSSLALPELELEIEAIATAG